MKWHHCPLNKQPDTHIENKKLSVSMSYWDMLELWRFLTIPIDEDHLLQLKYRRMDSPVVFLKKAIDDFCYVNQIDFREILQQLEEEE